MDESQEPQAVETTYEAPATAGRFSRWMQAAKSFITECKRVLTITKKPNREEFLTTVKISGIGILIIGAIGFILHLIKQLIF